MAQHQFSTPRRCDFHCTGRPGCHRPVAQREPIDGRASTRKRTPEHTTAPKLNAVQGSARHPAADQLTRAAQRSRVFPAQYWSTPPDSAGARLAKCLWTGARRSLSSSATAPRTGNEMACIGSASCGDRHRRRSTEGEKARKNVGLCELWGH